MFFEVSNFGTFFELEKYEAFVLKYNKATEMSILLEKKGTGKKIV